MIPASTALGICLLAWVAWTTIYRAENRKAIGDGQAIVAYVWTYMVIAMIVALRVTYPRQPNGSISGEAAFAVVFWPVHVTWVLVNKVFAP